MNNELETNYSLSREDTVGLFKVIVNTIRLTQYC